MMWMICLFGGLGAMARYHCSIVVFSRACRALSVRFSRDITFIYILSNRFALGFAEAPRGDDIHWSMTGDNQKLYRWRCRAATYANWPTLRYMLRGNTVSDAPLIIGSLDPCYSCTDRMTVVDVRKKKSQVVPYKELERYSIERKNSPLK